MSNDFIKGLLGNMSEQQLKELIESKAQKPEEAVEMLKQFAPMVVMILDQFIEQGGSAQVSMIAKEAHGSAVDFIAGDLPMAAMMLKTISKDDMAGALVSFKAQYTAEGVMEQVQNQRNIINQIDEDQHIALYETAMNILPPRMQAFYMSLYDMDDMSELPDTVRALRENIINSSDEELAEEMLEKINMISADDVYEVANDFAGHMSADRAQSLSAAFNKHVTPEAMANVAASGLSLTREFMQALADGKDPDLKTMQHYAPFEAALKDVLGGIEEAVMEADALPPSLKSWAAGAKGTFLPKP